MVSINKYTIAITHKAQNDINTLPSFIKSKVHHLLDQLALNPHLGKPLKGHLKNKFSLRASDYRIIYSIEHRIITIYVLKIAHRKDVYRAL